MAKDRPSSPESLVVEAAERSPADTKGSINLRIETHTRRLIDDAAFSHPAPSRPCYVRAFLLGRAQGFF
jgi:hypothetical protein